MDKQIEAEIWSLEEAYYTHECNGDYEKSFSLVHDRFLGWPEAPSAVVDKEGLIQFVKTEDSKIESYSFCITDKFGFRMAGNTAIVHYKVQFTGTTNKGGKFKESLHTTHTWIKEDLEWKLFCGMAYIVEK